MPRKKKTRQPASSRKRPVLPEGGLDSSMSLEEKRQKLEVYLMDFDIEAQGRIKMMKAFANSLISKIRMAFRVEMLKYPAHIRKMKLADFSDQGGQVNNAALKEASDVLSELANSVFQNAPQTSNRGALTEVGNTDLKTPGKRKRGKNAEEQSEPVSTAPRTLRTRKRKGVPSSPSASERQTRAKAAKTDGEQMPPPAKSTGRRTTRRNQSKTETQSVTPAPSKHPQYQTPFVTPKFDPRLPITPALLREAKAGERIMSLSGSPLANPRGPAAEAFANIPLGGGKTFQMPTTCDVSPRSLPPLNDIARRNIELLQTQLTRLLKVPPGMTKNK